MPPCNSCTTEDRCDSAGLCQTHAHEMLRQCARSGQMSARQIADEFTHSCPRCKTLYVSEQACDWCPGEYAAGVSVDARPCTCHPDDNPPKPCPRKFALTECRAAAGVTAGPICPHGIHMDNACGACIPPRGTTVGEDGLSRMAQVICDFTELHWGDCKELARRIAGVALGADGYCHDCEDVRYCGTIRKCLHGKPGTPGVRVPAEGREG